MPDPIPRGPFDQGLFLTHLNKGRELFEQRRFDEAERQLEEAYLLRPRDVRVLNLLGLVYFRSDKLDKAEEVYRKLIAESPDAHTLHYNLGLICFKLNRLEDAEQAFQKALDLTQGNPKIHFYLGSIYERLQRYKDAIYQYRQAGANLMVQRLQGKLDTATRGQGPGAPAGPPLGRAPRRSSADATAPPGTVAPPPRASSHAEDEAVLFGATAGKEVRPLSPALLSESGPDPSDLDETIPPRPHRPAPSAAAGSAPGASGDVFRGLEKGLMEVDFSGKVYIKQGTIYSYSGNLNFWVKDKRPGVRPSLVIVTGSGRVLLTDHDREITFLEVGEAPVMVEPSHLLACEEELQPRYVRLGSEESVEFVALEGRGMVALSVGSKPLPLAVNPGLPVSVPSASVIMWTGAIEAHVVEDPAVYAVVLPSAAGGGRLLRLEGTGRVLVEQATA